MKKTLLLISLVFVSLFRAQEIPFDKLIGNSAPQFYSIGHYPVGGTDGLLIVKTNNLWITFQSFGAKSHLHFIQSANCIISYNNFFNINLLNTCY